MKTALILLTLMLPLMAAPRLVPSDRPLQPTSHFEIVFDDAMVPQSEVEKEVANELVVIEPALEVNVMWRARNIARLIPQAAPAIGATYQVTLKEGLKNEKGVEIERPAFSKVTVSPFQVLKAVRRGMVRNDGLLLAFNDKVSAREIGPYFQFMSPETKEQKMQMVAVRTRQATWGDFANSRYYYRQSWQEQFRRVKPNAKRPPSDVLENAVVVEPVRPLPIGKGWTLNRLPGVPNQDGTALIEPKNAYRVGDVQPFESLGVSPRTVVDGERYIRVSFNQSLSRELSPEEVLSQITVHPRPEKLKASFDYRRQSVLLKGGLESGDSYEVSLPASFAGADGLTLGKNIKQRVQFRRADPTLTLPSFDQAQLASGSRKYEVESLNNRSLHVSIKKLSPDDLIRASQGYRHYTGQGGEGKRLKTTGPIPFVLIGGETVLDEEVEIKAALDTTAKHVIDWNKLLPAGQRSGAFFVSITGTPAEHPDLRRSASVLGQSIVQLTDLGLAWKITNDTAFLYAYSCHSGLPLPGVELALFGENAIALKKVTTDESGVARLPRGKEYRHLRATLEGDTFILPYDETLPQVDMWRFPVNFSWDESAGLVRDAYMFTDRNLYRPGEMIRLKGLVRKKDGEEFKLPEQKSPTLKVMDPLGREVVSREVALSEMGSFDFEYRLPATTVGRYRFELTWRKDLERANETESWREEQRIRRSSFFSHNVNVQEFKRNTFEEEAELVENEDHELDYQLSAQYFQGTPVAEAEAGWYLSARPTGIYPAKFRDFYFGNHREYDSQYWAHYFGYRDDEESSRSGSHFQSGEAKLDKDGKVSLKFTLPPIDYPMPRQVSVTTEITDANSQTLSSTSSTKVHSSDFYLGISRHDRLTRVGEEVPFKFVVVDQRGEIFQEDVQATLTISREEHTQVKSKAANGAVVVKNEKFIIPVREVVFKIPAGSHEFVLPFVPKEAGRHTFELTSRDGKGRAVRTVATRHVYGSDEYSWAYEAGMRIKLVPEQSRYQPGEKARILVLSPIEGEALVTMERRGVLRHLRTRLTLENPIIDLPLSNEDAPNVFVSVLIIKGAADSKRKHPEPQLRLGYCELTVDPLADRLKVEMAAMQSETRPGKAVQVKGRVVSHDGRPVSNAELVFYAEDEGTLSVAGYDNPDPLSHFHAPMALETRSGTSLENFIPETPGDNYWANKGFVIGGGDGEWEEEGENLRRNFDPCAAWMPALRTGSDGQFAVSFIAPDTLTRYRLIAVAHDGGSRFGTGLGEAVVNKPVMLEPSPPLFAHQGDRIRPKAILQNNSDRAGVWKVSLQLDSLTGSGAVDSPGQSGVLETFVELEPRSQGAVEFDVHFRNAGSVRWVWTATPKGLDDPVLRKSLSDAVESKFEVRYPMPLLTETNFVTFRDRGKEHNLLQGFSPELLDGVGELELEFARSRLSEAGAAIDYLLRYPYGCVEQTTSSTIPWVAAKRLRHLAPGFQKKSESEIAKAIQAGADRLLSMQARNGGLSYWPGAQEALPWASSYGGLGLVLCREAGANVPKKALDELASYLSGLLRNISTAKSSRDYEVLTRALYVLAILDKAEPAYHSKLLEKVEELTTSSRSFLALAMHESGQKGALDLLKQEALTGKETGYWMAHRSKEAFKLLAWATIDPSSNECEKTLNLLLEKRSKRGHWRTTWCNAWALLGMGAYAEAVEKDVQDITVTLVTSEGRETIVLPADQASHKVRIPLYGGIQAKSSADQKVFVHATLGAKPRIAPVAPVSPSGVTVNRIYERVKSDGSTEPLGDPRTGDLVKVTLEVTLPRDNFRYLAIDDPLPSSFQAINTDFKSQAGRVKAGKSWRVSHQEIRSDRVVFFSDYPGRSGKFTASYHARVTHAGDIYVPPTKVEEMYDPENFALGASTQMTVR